jgi:hypothetical protein
MALLPRIAGMNLTPTAGGRIAAHGAVANTDPGPLNELNQINALIYEGQSEFQYDQFSARQRQQHQQQQFDQQFAGQRRFDRFDRPFEQTPERRVNNSMLGNSSESFAAAFDIGKSKPLLASGELPRYQPNTSLDNIISTYEMTADVIYDKVAPRGEKLSMVL